MSLINPAPFSRSKHWLRLTLAVCSPTLACSAPVWIKLTTGITREATVHTSIQRPAIPLR